MTHIFLLLEYVGLFPQRGSFHIPNSGRMVTFVTVPRVFSLDILRTCPYSEKLTLRRSP